ncbi:FAD-dependent thymidylate synthase [Rhodococcoides fascians]|uniref:FAD-dependent thymidylate synthase n=1 Tax=Rhodococcoides fascians TaxID=1828 RepID=UPI00056282E8|nr:FAD-dependent thymidylate synthase [Rhodococcus fascians]
MSRVAMLDVQLIGHTVFTPPSAAGEDGARRPLFEPDDANLDEHDLRFDGQALAEFGGRLCYWSFDRPNAKTATNADYLLNILRQRHGSVLEHASVSFYLAGVSRSLTHELVRHRHFSFSQLSQRYVDSATAKMVMPPAFEGDADLTSAAACDFILAVSAYDEDVARLESKGLSKKQIREAARHSLPNSTETRLVVTGNYRAWIEFLVKRDNPAADAEIQRLAREIGAQLAVHAPNVFDVEARAVWDDSAAQEPAREVKP